MTHDDAWNVGLGPPECDESEPNNGVLNSETDLRPLPNCLPQDGSPSLFRCRQTDPKINPTTGIDKSIRHRTTRSPRSNRRTTGRGGCSRKASGEECLAIRGVTREAFFDHVLQAAENGQWTKLDSCLAPETVAALDALVASEPHPQIRPILAQLPGTTYKEVQIYLKCRSSAASSGFRGKRSRYSG